MSLEKSVPLGEGTAPLHLCSVSQRMNKHTHTHTRKRDDTDIENVVRQSFLTFSSSCDFVCLSKTKHKNSNIQIIIKETAAAAADSFFFFSFPKDLRTIVCRVLIQSDSSHTQQCPPFGLFSLKLLLLLLLLSLSSAIDRETTTNRH